MQTSPNFSLLFCCQGGLMRCCFFDLAVHVLWLSEIKCTELCVILLWLWEQLLMHSSLFLVSELMLYRFCYSVCSFIPALFCFLFCALWDFLFCFLHCTFDQKVLILVQSSLSNCHCPTIASSILESDDSDWVRLCPLTSPSPSPSHWLTVDVFIVTHPSQQIPRDNCYGDHLLS